MDIIIIALLSLLVAGVSFLIYKSLGVSTTGRRKMYIDTSALMDGRIVTAAQTGFIPDNLVIPASVVAELQLLADQADNEKRARARRGLDAIKELQDVESISVKILNDGPVGNGGVDARLVELAKKEANALLCTIDFNLNKVATVNGIEVVNINELAGSIRMAFLPGETISIALTQKGQSDNQAVGYLADGTMVVVDKAAKEVGNVVQVEFIRSLQTAAGRMMFAKLSGSSTESARKKSNETIKKLQNGSPKKAPKTNGRKIATTPSKQSPNTSRKRSTRRTAASREDSLIELVNNQ